MILQVHLPSTISFAWRLKLSLCMEFEEGSDH